MAGEGDKGIGYWKRRKVFFHIHSCDVSLEFFLFFFYDQ